MRALDLAVSPLSLTSLANLDLAAASGIVARGDRLYVVADDELQLAIFDHAGVRQGSIDLLPGVLPDDARERKAQKPDFEVLVACPDGSLLALGSGSTVNRCRGAWVCLETNAPDVRAIDASLLYAVLTQQLPELNIEGGAVLNDTLFLCSRGNGVRRENALIRLDWPQVFRCLQGDAVLPRSALLDIRVVELPELAGQPLGFTDLAAAGDQLIFSCAAEAGLSTYDDGECAGSALGLLSLDGAAHGCIAVSPPRLKIEGICALTASPNIQLRLVADADDRALRAPLMAAEWAV